MKMITDFITKYQSIVISYPGLYLFQQEKNPLVDLWQTYLLGLLLFYSRLCCRYWGYQIYFQDLKEAWCFTGQVVQHTQASFLPSICHHQLMEEDSD